jgi:hypothetical protein
MFDKSKSHKVDFTSIFQAKRLKNGNLALRQNLC